MPISYVLGKYQATSISGSLLAITGARRVSVANILGLLSPLLLCLLAFSDLLGMILRLCQILALLGQNKEIGQENLTYFFINDD